MSLKELPSRPDLKQYKKQAKDLLKAWKSADTVALQRLKQFHPDFKSLSDSALPSAKFALADAQFVIAREHGFDSWPKFAAHVETLNIQRAAKLTNPVDAFIDGACVPLEGSHGAGTLDGADAILADHPEVARANIYTASILGDDASVRRFLALDPRSATAKGGPREWDALTYLCFSRYLRIDRERSPAFVPAATALLDAGANPNTGWYEKDHQPDPGWECVLYGAAGLAHSADLTRLLLERGADPNDGETPYHAPEGYDNAALKVLVESGKLNEESLTTMLLRKTDWHDYEGIRYLLERGADPNRMTRWGNSALHHAVKRDNGITIIELFLDHGANPNLENRDHQSAVAIAARRGRGDVLDLLEQRNIPIELQGADRLIAECARNHGDAVRAIAAREPELVREVLAQGGTFLSEFAGNGNTDGVRQLLDLGVDVAASYKEGDLYFEVAKDGTALHSAAWRAWPSTVKLLIERGAPVNATDARGRTALQLAVRACVDSYWTNRRSPDSVEALLRAGAKVTGIDLPSGYAEVDRVLAAVSSAQQ